MTLYPAHDSARDRVEQAIAMGRSIDWIYDVLGAEPRFVDQVLNGMDIASRQADNARSLTVEPKRDRRGKFIAPHGTHTVYNRHKAAGEDPCDACRDAEQHYQAKRYLDGRASKSVAS